MSKSTFDREMEDPEFKAAFERENSGEAPKYNVNQILTKRPPEMSFEDYKLIRKYQTIVLKNLYRKPPNRKLMGLISKPTTPIITSKGFSKRNFNRKAS